MQPFLIILTKVALTAALIVGATLAAERLRPAWAGIIATIPLSSGAAHFMLALNESASFVAEAALGSLVASIAAFAYLGVFVRLAPRMSAFGSTACAFLTWLVLGFVIVHLEWTGIAAMIANLLAFAVVFRTTRSWRHNNGEGRKTRPSGREIAMRGGAAGLLATVVSVSAQFIGPTLAGMLAVFPVVYVSVAFIVHRRLGGEAASATMTAAVLPLVGVGLTFFTLFLLTPSMGPLPAFAVAAAVSLCWPLGIALRQKFLERGAFA